MDPLGAAVAVIVPLVGALVWLTKYILSTTLPGLTAAFREEQAADREIYKESLRGRVEHEEAEVKELQALNKNVDITNEILTNLYVLSKNGIVSQASRRAAHLHAYNPDK